MKPEKYTKLKFIDLFAGIGGTRLGFEKACINKGLSSECVFTSEIKDYACFVYKDNFGANETIHGDITKIDSSYVPDFDILLAGFPCQPFSSAGSRKGFADTRGTLFFEIQRLIENKKPLGFILENVEGLVNHDRVEKHQEMGNTLSTILTILKSMGYHVSWKILDASEFGVPQKRRRLYITGSLVSIPNLEGLSSRTRKLFEILESGLKSKHSIFTEKLLQKYAPEKLYGKSIKDKRGGRNNIHSWDIGLKGEVSKKQKELLNHLLKQRRQKKWALNKGIKWMDGMPLTFTEIETFAYRLLDVTKSELRIMLDDLVKKGYLKYEHPKDIHVLEETNGARIPVRKEDESKEKGYNIVSGKLSFEITKILDPQSLAPTLVATDVDRIGVIDGAGIRKLTVREGLRLFGFPETYTIDVPYRQAYDLLGNTVVVPVVEKVSERLLDTITQI